MPTHPVVVAETVKVTTSPSMVHDELNSPVGSPAWKLPLHCASTKVPKVNIIFHLCSGINKSVIAKDDVPITISAFS